MKGRTPFIEAHKALLALLLDRGAALEERVEAASWLHEYDHPEVENALRHVATDIREDEDLADQVGEALFIIWKRTGRRDDSVVASMHPSAKKFFGHGI